MARKRMIDPNFWRDEKIGELNFSDRLIFIGLWTFAEDSGVGRANPKLLKADILPYDDTFRVSDFEKSLEKLATLKLIFLYESAGQKYYYIPKFLKHQTINRPSPLTLPVPSDEQMREWFGGTHGVLSEQCMSTHGALTTQIEVNIKENNIKEKNTKEKKKFVPLKGDVCSGNDQAGVESPKPDNKPPFESQRKEILPTQAVEEVESMVSTSKKESTTNQQDKDSSGMVKNFNKEECLTKLCKLYRTGRNNKTESRKNYFGYLTGTKRDRVDNRLYRYNHIQLYIAAEKYLREQREVPSDKVKLLSSYLSERVRDDVEATRNEYESEMRKHYGENWKEVRFVYD